MEPNQERAIQALGAEYDGFIQARLAEEAAYLRQYWEPRLAAAWEDLPAACLKALAALWPAGPASPPGAWWLAGVRFRWQAACAALLAPRLVASRELLAEMVAESADELGRIITINGLLAPLPRLSATGGSQPARFHEALERAVRASLAAFQDAVLEQLASAPGDEPSRAAALAGLAPLAASFGQRLATVAGTVLGAASSGVQRALGDRL